jgi:hypothetical protein
MAIVSSVVEWLSGPLFATVVSVSAVVSSKTVTIRTKTVSAIIVGFGISSSLSKVVVTSKGIWVSVSVTSFGFSFLFSFRYSVGVGISGPLFATVVSMTVTTIRAKTVSAITETITAIISISKILGIGLRFCRDNGNNKNYAKGKFHHFVYELL